MNTNKTKATKATNSVIKLTVSDAPQKTSEKAHAKINLGKGLVFDNAYDVLEHFEANEGTSVPLASYKNALTTTFLKGSLEGQVDSLFKDFKKYGRNVAPKVGAFIDLLKSGSSTFILSDGTIVVARVDLNTETRTLIEALKESVNPSHSSMLVKGRVNNTYLKLWILAGLSYTHEINR